MTHGHRGTGRPSYPPSFVLQHWEVLRASDAGSGKFQPTYYCSVKYRFRGDVPWFPPGGPLSNGPGIRQVLGAFSTPLKPFEIGPTLDGSRAQRDHLPIYIWESVWVGVGFCHFGRPSGPPVPGRDRTRRGRVHGLDLDHLPDLRPPGAQNEERRAFIWSRHPPTGSPAMVRPNHDHPAGPLGPWSGPENRRPSELPTCRPGVISGRPVVCPY